MKDSPTSRLEDHPYPIDFQAVRVGFFKGEHFDVEFTDKRPKRRLTMECPPKKPIPPAGFRDHSGERNGRMVAMFWVGRTNNGESSWWVVKCDCGRYELRKKLGKWHKKYGGNDKCEVCEREKEMLRGNIAEQPKKNKKAERVLKWIEEMRCKGLSETEIKEIYLTGGIETKGKNVGQIRASLSRLRKKHDHS